MSRKIPLSVRISEKEAEFLAELQIGDAVTPSEKVRALLDRAIEESSRESNQQRQLEAVQTWIRATFMAIKEAEAADGKHSELLALFFEWQDELLEHLGRRDRDGVSLSDFERGTMALICRLSDRVLRLAITPKADCYDPELIHKSALPLVELAKMIEERS